MSRLAVTSFAVAFAVAVALAPVAEASQQSVVAGVNWKQMDLCAKQAQAAFPDFTAASNAMRDTKMKECLESKNLPPREPASPPH
jgi:erythromycin esterase-like protein